MVRQGVLIAILSLANDRLKSKNGCYWAFESEHVTLALRICEDLEAFFSPFSLR